jgi:hypothetical protein
MHTIDISPHCERSSLEAMSFSTCGDSSSSSIVPITHYTSNSPGFIPPTPDISCSQPHQPRFETPRARQKLRQGLTPRPEGHSDVYGLNPRSYTQSSTNVSVGMADNSHISGIGHEKPSLQQDHRSNHVLADDQVPRSTAYHLPLRAIGRHQEDVIPTTRRHGVQFF